MTTYYLRFEGVNLDNFVFDTKDLSTIRGGSLMLLDAIHKIEEETGLKLVKLSTGASIGLFQFEAQNMEEAVKLLEEVRKILKEPLETRSRRGELKHATFIVDILNKSSNFKNDKQSLLALNYWQQIQSPSCAIPSENKRGWEDGMQCELDLIRPAVDTVDTADGRKKVSASVKTRREYGRFNKQNFYWKQTGLPKGRDFAQDFDELTSNPSLGNLHHKMAVILIDGNGFGKLQDQVCTTPKKQTEFDDYIRGKRSTFLKALLEDKVIRGGTDWVSNARRYRMEILLWGGDEIIFVVPAWKGWELLSFFYENSMDWDFLDRKLTHASSIVFCHHNAPIKRIKDLAYDLIRSVKDNDSSHGKNMFVYQVLESFDYIGQDVMFFREKRVPLERDAAELILPGANMNILTEQLPKLREFIPRSKLHQLVRYLQTDLSKATEVEQYIRKIPELRKPLSEMETYFAKSPTLWFHIAELWDYVAPGEG